VDPEVTIRAEHGCIRYLYGRHAELRIGRHTEIFPLESNPHRRMMSSLGRWLRDGPAAAPGAALETARAHVVAVNAASEAAPVRDVPPGFLEECIADDDAPLRAIRQIVPAMTRMIDRGCLLDGTGLAPWAQPAAPMPINGYAHFSGPRTDAAAGDGESTSASSLRRPTSASPEPSSSRP
jgi:hypothetical protein